MKLKFFPILLVVFLLSVGGLFASSDLASEDSKMFRLSVPVDVMALDGGRFDSASVLIKIGDNLFSYEYFEGIDIAHDQLLALFSGQPEVADRVMDVFLAGDQQIEINIVYNGSQMKTMTFDALQKTYADVPLDNYISAKIKMSLLFKGAKKVLGKSLYNLITGYYPPEAKNWLEHIAGDTSNCIEQPDFNLTPMPWQKPDTEFEGLDVLMYTSCYNVNTSVCPLTYYTRSTTYTAWEYYMTVVSNYPLDLTKPILINPTSCYKYYYKKYKRTKTTKDIYYVTCNGTYCEYPGTVTYEYLLVFDRKVVVACP